MHGKVPSAIIQNFHAFVDLVKIILGLKRNVKFCTSYSQPYLLAPVRIMNIKQHMLMHGDILSLNTFIEKTSKPTNKKKKLALLLKESSKTHICQC